MLYCFFLIVNKVKVKEWLIYILLQYEWIKKYDSEANKLKKLNPKMNNHLESKNEKTGLIKDWNLYEIMLDFSLLKIVIDNNQKWDRYPFAIVSTIDFARVESEFIEENI